MRCDRTPSQLFRAAAFLFSQRCQLQKIAPLCFNLPLFVRPRIHGLYPHVSATLHSLPNLLPLHSHTSNAASTTQPQQLHRHDSHPIHPPNYPITNHGAPYRFSSSSSTIRHIGGFFVFIFFVLVFGPSCEWTSSQPIDSKPTNKKRFIQQPSTTITTSAVHNHN